MSKHKHLAKTYIFWCALVVPLLAGGVLGGLIGYNGDIGGVCFSRQCVESFFNTFKFPLAIMGLSLPLVAMVAAIHRSIEAALQIEVSSSQYAEAIKNNRFGNYLKHREGFEKLVDGYCARQTYGVKGKTYVFTPYFYASIFPEASFDNIDWNGQYHKGRLHGIRENASILMDQIAATDEDFICEIFMISLGVLLRYMHVNYTESRVVVFPLKPGEPPLEFTVPAVGTEADCIFRAINDAFNILTLLMNYVGIKDERVYSLKGSASRVGELLKRSAGRYYIYSPNS